MDLFGNADLALPFELPRGDRFSARWNEALKGHEIAIPNGKLFYAERYFSKEISDRCVEYFQENDTVDRARVCWKDYSEADFSKIRFNNINWVQDKMSLFGRTVPLPRWTSWYGDSGKSYTYSGITSTPNEWNKGLLYLKREIERCAGVEFNSVLMNWYRSGEDHLSWHADDEKELGSNPIIASASFGETRDFALRRKDDKSMKITMPLMHGTLLLMSGELQHFWEHSVPKRKKVTASRFNLTFRRIKNQ